MPSFSADDLLGSIGGESIGVAMLKGKALTTTRVVISRDGKTRTNTVTGQDAQGRTINNTVVYEKR